ncbi:MULTISPECIES: AAA family ATPase [unclassified Marinobacter]|uniref:ExeA family protein n=1 Tax=unclassified Marinobacter TaxID=83889 RepID=UPI00200E588F|nr:MULTISPECIES: AAA family ATPase [unclassified Marinobacter]UQG54132.1 AAA family ATPase [Marinobacter sp. M4C]UQG62939.1 AAA family ATPase [Marinobacter sp. M2C]UQG67217.1 AAA family ATPase [Marinobacter sp. M1C]
MYYDFFGFREPPFSIAPDPRYLYLSERHKEALAHLMYGIPGQGGFIVITGEVGTGKTTICRCFIESAPQNADIALIINPRLSVAEMLMVICDELEILHRDDASIKQLVDLINHHLLQAHAAGRHKVLIIDEAQNLSADVLEQLRLLTNLETAEKKLLQIVLLGQPELQNILALPQLRQLNQRITARYHLKAINRQELAAYLHYRLSVAGVRSELFSRAATRRLFRESQGIPRLINLISDRALLGAYADGEHEITAVHIRTAAREVRGSHPSSGQGIFRLRRLGPLLASLLMAIVITVWAVQRWNNGDFDGLMSAPAAEIPVAEVAPTDNESTQRSGRITRASVSPATVAETAVRAGGLTTFELQAHSLELPAAFVALFGAWQIDYQPQKVPIACDFARAEGLGCLERTGTRLSLELLDRPAILKLRGGLEGRLQSDVGNTRDRYVVLRRLHQQQADLLTQQGPVSVAFGDLEPLWFGDYRVLWQYPEYLRLNSPFSAANGENLWLSARMMELVDRLTADDQTLNAELKRRSSKDQVRWYQGRKGLAEDGIAGAMTVIQMHNDLNAAVPRLQDKGDVLTTNAAAPAPPEG